MANFATSGLLWAGLLPAAFPATIQGPQPGYGDNSKLPAPAPTWLPTLEWAATELWPADVTCH